MAIAKITGAQRDFSAGELDVAMKRADENPLMKAGARQLANFRILNSRAVQNRPGRSALFQVTGATANKARVEEVTLSPGNVFKLVFTQGSIAVVDKTGTQVAALAGRTWLATNLNQISWAALALNIYICFPGMQPLIVTWDGVATWTNSNFTEYLTPGGQKRTFFYRITPPGTTLDISAATGNVTVFASPGFFVPGHVGTRMRFCGRQILITSYVSNVQIAATVEEQLPPGQNVDVTAASANVLFNVGDVVLGSVSGAKGIVTLVQGAPFNQVSVQLLTIPTSAVVAGGSIQSGLTADPTATVTVLTNQFTTQDTIVGPGGSAPVAAVATVGPSTCAVFDDEVMNTFRGYPAHVFVDQGRLGFCNFPAVPRAIGWSAINNPTDCYVDAPPQAAMMELVPDNAQVRYVVPGPESSEFVFTDKRIYYIPINATTPLIPGSVAFQILSDEGCAAVQPRAVKEVILYVAAGGIAVNAVVAPGAYYRPFETRNLSELHAHLIKQPVAIAVPTADGTFEERYAYLLNSDGSIAVAKYSVKNGQIDGPVGWLPWTGAGTPTWLAALGGDVIFTTQYAPNGIAAALIVEKLDDTQYLDGALPVNAPPAAFTPPGGKGPLYFIPGGAVTLMDQGTRMMGTYQVDANGNIIPQGNAGENLASAQLVAGLPWTAVLEPFVPDASPGQSVHQRMFKRRVSRMAIYISNSTGFLMARLFSGPVTRTSPALGTIMNTRRVTTWNQDDDPTQPPPLREEAQRWRPIGRSYDPRVAIIKDTPGPLLVHEVGLESTV